MLAVAMSILLAWFSSPVVAVYEDFTDVIVRDGRPMTPGIGLAKVSRDGFRFGWVEGSETNFKPIEVHTKTLGGDVNQYVLNDSQLYVDDLLVGDIEEPNVAIISSSNSGELVFSIDSTEGKLDSKNIEVPVGTSVEIKYFWGENGQCVLSFRSKDGQVQLVTYPGLQSVIPLTTEYDGISVESKTKQVLFFPHGGPGESGRIYDHNRDGFITQCLPGTAGYAKQPLVPDDISSFRSAQVHVSACDFIQTEKCVALVNQVEVKDLALFYWKKGDLCDVTRLRNPMRQTQLFLGMRFILAVGNVGDTVEELSGRVVVIEITKDDELKILREIDFPFGFKSVGANADKLQLGAVDSSGTMHSIQLLPNKNEQTRREGPE